VWEEKKDKFYVKKRGEKQIISCPLFPGKNHIAEPGEEKINSRNFSRERSPFASYPYLT
jgi:hypothetical protein